MPNLQQMPYAGWEQCHRLHNDHIEVVITGDVGPRLIRFGQPGGANLFYEDPATLGQTDSPDWHIYGGHRFWHAPEADPRSYQPDNRPVKVTATADETTVTVAQPTEPATGMQKTLVLSMTDERPHLRVTHHLTNNGLWPVTCAPWALSVMAAGGVGILPVPPRGTHAENLLPTHTMTLWAYTDFSDPRWTLGREYVLLRQDSRATTPQKVGMDVQDGWAAYLRDGTLFVKAFSRVAGAAYPDKGSTAELFTNDVMLEVESLGPLTNIPPKETVTHVEDWFLFTDVPPVANDAEVTAHVLPHVRAALAMR